METNLRLVLASVVVAISVGLSGCQKQPTVRNETKEEKRREVVKAFSGGPSEEGGEHAASIQKFFDEFGDALSSGNSKRVATHWDNRMTFRLLKAQNLLPPKMARDEDMFLRIMDPQIGKHLSDPIMGARWERIEIRKVHLSDNKEEATVYTRQWDKDDTSFKMRWWLNRDGDRWRAYDFENLELSMRFTVLIGVGAKMGKSNDPSAKFLPQFIEAFAQGVNGEVVDSLAMLQELDGKGFPDAMESVRLMMIAAFLSDETDFAESNKAADRAISINPDMPYVHLIYAANYTGLGKYDKALKHAELYAKQLGKDADYYSAIGDARAAQGKTREAIEAYESGLKDDPLSGTNVLGLIRLLPKERQGKLLGHYKRLNEPDEWFVAMADMLLEHEDKTSLATLIELHKKVMPDDDNIALYEEVLDELTGD